MAGQDDPADITFPANVELLFDDGAVLVPASARATINGRVTAHPLQQIFGGAGRVDAVAGPDAFLTVSGDPYSNYAIEVTITDTGAVGVSQFTYSVNGNNDLDHGPSTKKSPTAANFPIPGTGLTLHFAPNTYDEDDLYSISAYAPIVLAPASFEHADVMSFGAKPDEDDDATRAGNTIAMHTALGALRAAGNVATSIVARGKFYFSDTIHVCQTILLRGTGRADSADVSGGGASVPGTWFFFPNDVQGIHLYSGYAAQGGSDNTQIRDLTIAVDEPEGRLVKNGITLNAIATLDHVTVKFFGGHGIFVSAGDKDPAEPGIAAGFVLNACIVGGCGGDGFQTLGSDANVGLIINCNADSNRGFGFRDRTVVNTYIGCHAAGNQGLDPEAADPMVVVYRNYAAWGPPNDESDPVVLAGPNNCVFIGCYSEGDTEAVQNMIGFGATIIGGQPGYQQQAVLRNAATTPLDIDWAGWTTSSNLIDGQPLTYDKRIPGASSADLITTTVEVGQKTNWGNLADGATNNPGILNFKLKAAKAGVRLLSDANVLRYAENFGWWFLEKGPGTSTLWIPGDVTPPRRIAPLFPNGIIFQTTPSLMELEDRFGPPDPETSMEMVSHTGSATRPEPPLELQTFEVGDVVWSGDTSGRGPLGWRCTKAGTWAAADPTLTADVDVDGTDVTITFKDVGGDPAFAGYLELWAYVRIGEEPAPMDPDERFVVQIVSLPTAVALGTVKARLVEPLTTPAEDTGLPVVFAPPVIVPFGTQATAATGAADYLFTEEAVHVACDTAPRTVTLPADPWDGAYFEIKSAGVAGADPDHITVDAGLRTIDGVNPVKIEAPYGFLCVRYNASLDQWFSVAQQLT